MRRYSRLASVEAKRNVKSAYFYIILSIVAVILLIFFGLPLLVRFAGFVGDIAKSDKPVEIQDITPPAPPQFEDVPEYTSEETIDIKGISESAATIKIRANNNESEVITNNEGIFNFTFHLKNGENTIDAIAIDLSGNESTQTQTFTIVHDDTEPKIEIESPADSSSYFGNGQRQLSIKGNVDETVDLSVNDRFVSQKDDGNFTFTTTLQEGENKFLIKAIDPAGNTTETSITVNFSS